MFVGKTSITSKILVPLVIDKSQEQTSNGKDSLHEFNSSPDDESPVESSKSILVESDLFNLLVELVLISVFLSDSESLKLLTLFGCFTLLGKLNGFGHVFCLRLFSS